MAFLETTETDRAPSALAHPEIATVTPSWRTRTRSTPRRNGLTALILGFFSAAWFSWGPPDASDTLSTALTIGSCTALVVGVLGAFRFYDGPRADGALHNRSDGRRYGIIVSAEFTLVGLGAAVLGASGASAYVPVWVCAVVGVHFFPLAALLRTPALRWLGAALSAVACAALLVGELTDVPPSSVTGSGAGLALLAYASLALTSRVQAR